MTQHMLLDLQSFPAEISSFLDPIYQLAFPPQGDTSAVAVVDTARGKYVVKRSSGEQFSSWIKQEYHVLTALIHSTLPTPYPHLFVQRETTDGLESWFVMSYLSGDPLIIALENEADQEERLSILRAFGNTLAVIHRHSLPSELHSDRTLSQAEYNFRHYPTEGSAELLEQLKQHRPHLFPPTLIHGDFTVENVLITEGKVTGIIDWAGGGIGDPRYDLALAIRPKKTGLFQTQQDRQAFFEGYGLSELSQPDSRYFVDLYEFF